MAVRREYSPEEREARSQRALAQIAKGDGKFGGRQPGSGRPRKVRVSAEINEVAMRRSPEIIDALFKALTGNNVHASLKAAELLTRIADREATIEIDEARRAEQMSTHDLLDGLRSRLEALREAGALQPALGQVEVVRVDREETADDTT